MQNPARACGNAHQRSILQTGGSEQASLLESGAQGALGEGLVRGVGHKDSGLATW